MTLNINELVRGGTLCLSKAGFGEGSGDAGFKIAAPNGAGVDYVINGTLYHKADTANIAVGTAAAEQTLGTTCLYIFQLDSSGNLTVVKGTEVSNTDLAAGNKVLEWPTPTVNKCPIAAAKVAAGTTAFTIGTDDITDDVGTGTITFYDLMSIPATPLTS